MTIARILTRWKSNFNEDGFTVMYVDAVSVTQASIDAATAAVRSFWVTLVPSVPDEYSLVVEGEVLQLSEVTGELTNVYTSSGSTTPVSGGSPQEFARGVGVRIDWSTGQIVRRRRVKGRTYVVPLHVPAFDTEGTMDAAIVTGFTAAANDLIADLQAAGHPLVVWSRPSVGGSDGARSLVTTGACIDKPAILRKRRD